jgi:hypothetical protein
MKMDTTQTYAHIRKLDSELDRLFGHISIDEKKNCLVLKFQMKKVRKSIAQLRELFESQPHTNEKPHDASADDDSRIVGTTLSCFPTLQSKRGHS